MYIEKRWLVPAGLSLLLVGAFFAGALLLLGSRFGPAPATLSPAQIRSIEAQSRDSRPVTEAVPVAAPAPIPAVQAAPAAVVQPASPVPEEVVGISTRGTSQINTRGFGDIGLQFQDVNINGPITMVHVSNQGNNNSTNIATGTADRISSDQRHLQSNRSDASPPPAASAVGATPAPADSRPAQRVARAVSRGGRNQ